MHDIQNSKHQMNWSQKPKLLNPLHYKVLNLAKFFLSCFCYDFLSFYDWHTWSTVITTFVYSTYYVLPMSAREDKCNVIHRRVRETSEGRPLLEPPGREFGTTSLCRHKVVEKNRWSGRGLVISESKLLKYCWGTR